MASHPSFHRDVADEPYLALGGGQGSAPGFGRVERPTDAGVKWLGGDTEQGPWIYWVERSAGDLIPPHRHKAGRVEFIMHGAIEWHEGDDAVEWYRNGAAEGSGTRYEQGSLTWVPAGRVYGYRMLEDTTVLLWFDGSPGGTEWAT